MTKPNLPETVRQSATSALRLALVLAEAEAIQWSPSTSPKPRDDTTERARGGHSDPTLATVADERRLAVRAAVDSANETLRDYVDTLNATRRAVETVVSDWAGH